MTPTMGLHGALCGPLYSRVLWLSNWEGHVDLDKHGCTANTNSTSSPSSLEDDAHIGHMSMLWMD